MAPTVIPGTPKRKGNYKREQFEAAIQALAPIIADIQAEGRFGVEEIRKSLNSQGIKAPSGRKFNNRSTHLALTRLAEMNLGPGPRSVSHAMRDRWDRKHEKMREETERVIAEQALRKKKTSGP